MLSCCGEVSESNERYREEGTRLFLEEKPGKRILFFTRGSLNAQTAARSRYHKSIRTGENINVFFSYSCIKNTSARRLRVFCAVWR